MNKQTRSDLYQLSADLSLVCTAINPELNSGFDPTVAVEMSVSCYKLLQNILQRQRAEIDGNILHVFTNDRYGPELRRILQSLNDLVQNVWHEVAKARELDTDVKSIECITDQLEMLDSAANYIRACLVGIDQNRLVKGELNAMPV